MNGETALLWPKRMRPPTRPSIATTGRSHQAFRCHRNAHSSPMRALFANHFHFHDRLENFCHTPYTLCVPVTIHHIAWTNAPFF